MESNHQAIIERDMWEQVQVELERGNELGSQYSSSDTFVSKLICKDCGGFYEKRSGIPIASIQDLFTNVITSSINIKTNVKHLI